uniref:Uncharacterized protein n=1 Tax=Anguilla anguilla TaxID=7936 RepID=A0A0E9UH15_ANGAN
MEIVSNQVEGFVLAGIIKFVVPK